MYNLKEGPKKTKTNIFSDEAVCTNWTGTSAEHPLENQRMSQSLLNTLC